MILTNMRHFLKYISKRSTSFKISVKLFKRCYWNVSFCVFQFTQELITSILQVSPEKILIQKLDIPELFCVT